MTTKFRDVPIGQPFDWIDPSPGARNSFFEPCFRTGARTYRVFGSDMRLRVGSIDANVFHVGTALDARDKR
jgi:hypothetical protein